MLTPLYVFLNAMLFLFSLHLSSSVVSICMPVACIVMLPGVGSFFFSFLYIFLTSSSSPASSTSTSTHHFLFFFFQTDFLSLLHFSLLTNRGRRTRENRTRAKKKNRACGIVWGNRNIFFSSFCVPIVSRTKRKVTNYPCRVFHIFTYSSVS